VDGVFHGVDFYYEKLKLYRKNDARQKADEGYDFLCVAVVHCSFV